MNFVHMEIVSRNVVARLSFVVPTKLISFAIILNSTTTMCMWIWEVLKCGRRICKSKMIEISEIFFVCCVTFVNVKKSKFQFKLTFSALMP